MKRLILPLLFLLCSIPKLASSQSAMQFANAQLRSLFSNIANPNPSVDFSYDLSGHFVDSAYFNEIVTDTSNPSNWYALYQEMYYMAYDTNQFMTANDVYMDVLPKAQSDTIPIGIIDWDYNLLQPDALTTGTYFDFDTVNTLLYDLPGAPTPFTQHTTFAGTTLREEYPFTNPIFIVNPQWFFKDATKIYGGADLEFKIDFDDGNGWQSFSQYAIDHYQANYGSGGMKYIQYGVFSGGTLRRYSMSSIRITGERPSFTPSSTVHLPGITASIYEPSNSCNVNTEKKYVIFLEGIDVLDRRHGPQIYGEMINHTNMAQLKNFGYTFVVVDWVNGNGHLKDNAMNLVGLIEYLKCSTPPLSRLPPQPFIMVGESMGGPIARYALSYMESSSYSPTNCSKGIAHNTRLLITIDAPHQGAAIPLGLQYLYRYGTTGALSLVGFSPWVLQQFQTYLTVIDGSASTELLRYHIATDPFVAAPISIAPIFEHPAKTVFDGQLAALGGYPRYCKLVAMSNGSWLGAHQPVEWNMPTVTPRQPNDKILDIDAEVYIRVLGIKILGTKFKLDVKTNPSSSGQVFFSGVGISHWKIKLKWFGAKLVWWTDYPIQVTKSVMNVKPYCVMPGSTNADDISIGANTNASFNNFNVLDLFEFSKTVGSGNLNVKVKIGSSFFSSANLNFNAYSDGTQFGFIHPTSAIDYQTPSGQPLDYALLNDPIATTLGRTPFHAVYTNPTGKNWNHLTVVNPALGTCQTCQVLPGASPIQSYLLNREIGDDLLWLENTNARYNVPIEVERDLYINERNPFYNYVAQNSTYFPNNLAGLPANYSALYSGIVLSKELPVNFAFPGQLRSNNNLYVNPSQPPTGSYQWLQGNMTICCIDYVLRRSNPQPFGEKMKSSKLGSMTVYPNPAQEQLTVQYQMATGGKVRIIIYDLVGKQLVKWEPNFDDHTQLCHHAIPLSDLQLSNGSYIIEVTNGSESYKSKIVVTR